MSLSDGWFSQTVEVRRYQSTVANYTEEGEFETLYAELPTAIQGDPSQTESTIVGKFGLSAMQLIWRGQDIGEAGWPQENDVVILGGKQYFINQITDHTFVPALFSGIPAHKVATVSEEVINL